MRLHIENLLAHQDRHIDIAPGVTLVTGQHSAGKTSIATVLGALAAHEGNPMGLSAAERKAMVTDGASEGHARLETPDGDVILSVPGPGGLSTPLRASPVTTRHAAGLVDFVAAKSRDARFGLWEDLFVAGDPEPLLEGRLPKDQIGAICSVIRQQGWDRALAYYVGLRRDAKAKWEATTGSRYGGDKAARWRPDGWLLDLEMGSEKELRADVVNAEDRLAALQTQVTVEQSKIDEGIEARDEKLPRVRERQSVLQGEVNIKRAEYKAVLLEMNRLKDDATAAMESSGDAFRKLRAQPPLECPECSAGLKVINDTLVAWHPLSDAERADLERVAEDRKHAAKEIMSGAYAEAKDRVAELSKEISEAQSLLDQAIGQVTELARIARYAEMNPKDHERDAAFSAADEAVRDSRRRYEMWRRWRQAEDNRMSVLAVEDICSVLGKSGVRAAVMEERMAYLRRYLGTINKKTGWLPIDVTENYLITSGGRPIQMAADNERLKAQWSLQAAVAMLCPGSLMILDGVELRDESWDGLVALMNGLVASRRKSLRVVVCSTARDVPDGWHGVHLA